MGKQATRAIQALAKHASITAGWCSSGNVECFGFWMESFRNWVDESFWNAQRICQRTRALSVSLSLSTRLILTVNQISSYSLCFAFDRVPFDFEQNKYVSMDKAPRRRHYGPLIMNLTFLLLDSGFWGSGLAANAGNTNFEARGKSLSWMLCESNCWTMLALNGKPLPPTGPNATKNCKGICLNMGIVWFLTIMRKISN